ncbi:MAG: sulfurtransferase [Leptolyngbya sp. SIO1E4]|nr:sulfurtransferase [Leptolyngbya sp. SIO1E4]
MPTPLVDITWLQEHLHHPEVVIIDCRFALNDPHQGRRAYEQGHLPGAYYLDLNQDLSSPVQRHGGRHPLPELAPLIAKLESLGIASDPATAVVAYDATKGAFAARLWWLLRYLGHENVAVLDGGFPAWKAAQLPLEQITPALPQPGSLTPRIQSDWVVDRDYVMQRQTMPGAVLVDARSPERFRGEQEPIDPIAGSIPGAVNVFWQSNLDEQGRFKPIAELQQQWAVSASADDLVFYCGSGVTACVNILARMLLNHPMPKLYVGGWSDWCSYHSAGSSRQ